MATRLLKKFVSPPSDRIKSVVLLVMICAVTAVLYLYSPSESRLYPSCPFKMLTGLECPGCGTLRGLHALTHGNIGAAFGLNALMVLSLPFIVYSAVKYIVTGILGREQHYLFIPSVFIWALLGGVILFGILRNLPYHPFVLLSP